MNSEEFYKQLYEASEKDRVKAQAIFFQYVLNTLECDIGVGNYYDFLDFVVIDRLKGVVEILEGGSDIWETPDNKVHDLSAAYRMVEYFSTGGDFKMYVQGRRDKANETT